ncbi:hypothetical protein E3N88_09768 [Mikania micrantha]|uniref:Uncharacterized protein n=1 Tax=Mikania micrantha TaxID=192012 RepID=A0A5N6PKP2_9ASTR|nr:hypothetical protein E3N88_09768 [Mikania micrantha]
MSLPGLLSQIIQPDMHAKQVSFRWTYACSFTGLMPVLSQDLCLFLSQDLCLFFHRAYACSFHRAYACSFTGLMPVPFTGLIKPSTEIDGSYRYKTS